MSNINIDINSIFPLIINIIKNNFELSKRLVKLISANPYSVEFVVLVSVSIDNLNEFSKFIPLRLKREVSMKIDKINIKIVKKYLLISLKSKLILVNINLFINIFFGLLKDKI